MFRNNGGNARGILGCAVAMATCSGWMASKASAQLVVGADPTGTQSIWLIDVTGNEPNRALVTASTTIAKPWGMAADEDNQILYWNNGGTLYKAAYTQSGELTVQTIGSMTLGGSAMNVTGMAYDTLEDKLYGYRNITTPGFYEISTVDATCTLVLATPGDFGGFDYDPVTDAFYGLNDTAVLSGIGLYRIAKPLGAPTFTLLTGYPAGETDIDGLAVGGGRAYFVNDNGAQVIPVYNLVTLAFEASLPVPITGSGTFSAGAWAPGMIIPPTGPDLRVTVTDPADCTVGVGGSLTYSIIVQNIGTEVTTNVVLDVDLPDEATFLSSTPSGTPVGGILTLNLGSISPGNSVNVSVNVTPISEGTLTNSVTVSATEADPNTNNNTAVASTLVHMAIPATAPIKGIISTIASSPTSDVPDLTGKFAANGIFRPYVSPDGTKWIMNADTDLATTIDEIVVAGTLGGSFSVVVQEGVTALAEGDIVGLIDNTVGINDAGHFAFSADTNAATTSDEVIVKWNGTQFVTVAREGSAAPPIPGATWGATRDSASIQNDGTVSFYSNLANAGGTTMDTGYFTDDGTTLLAREGVTIPTNQGNGTTYVYDLFQTGATEGSGLFLNASGSSFVGIIDVITAPVAEDRTVTVDNDIKIQEGFIIAGSPFGSIVASASPLAVVMTPNGDWLSYGSNADGQDWAVRNGAVVASTDSEIFPGAGENWDDAPYAQTYFYIAGNNNGDYAVAGTTNSANDRANAVIVLNGATVVARENDPIDLDNNGLFDDGVFIRTFLDDRIAMTNNEIICVVRLRDTAAALCGATDTDIGQALISIPIGGGTGPLPCCKGDIDGSAHVDAGDINEFIAQLVLEVGGDPCPLDAADVNNDTVVDGLDISPFVDRILANGGAGTVCP